VTEHPGRFHEENPALAKQTGTVIEVHAARCVVDAGADEPLECRYRGRLAQGARKTQSLLVIGDRVRVEIDGADAVVAEVLPRENELSRQASRGRGVRHVFAANLDHALVLAAVAEPPLRTGFVDRCLASARVFDIDPIIALNKVDLLDAASREDVDAVARVYREAGFPCDLVSVATGEGIAALAGRLRGRTTVLVGQSGVGKTSLLNRLLPGSERRTAQVSEATGKGMHTTTSSRLFPLEGGGFLADTPGVRAFALEAMDPLQIALAYPEFEPFVASCRFRPCTHVHEPTCAVRAAVEAGEIATWRYETYVRIVEATEPS